MAEAALRLKYTFEEYARFEATARERHEFVGGRILAMAGGTLEHSRLASAVIAALAAELRGKACVVLGSNARVRVAATGSAYYPDATVVCDQMIPDPGDPLSLSNPTVLVEVLSPSTEEYDRTDKLSDYRRIPSVQHVVFVMHDAHRVDVHTRGAEGFVVRSFEAGQMAELPAIGCVLDVREIYRDPLAH